MSKRQGCIGMGMVPGETELGKFVRKRRLSLGLSQIDLTNRAKHFKCISDLETGKRYCYDIKDYQLEELAEALQCDLNELRKLMPDKCPPKTELGKLIRSRRRELNMSIEQFSRSMNITLRKARIMERQAKLIDSDLIKLLSVILSLDAEIFAKFKKKGPESRLGQLMQKRRKELGLTIYVLAEKLGITKQAVNQIELGKSPLNSNDDMVKRLAEVLKIDENELLAVRSKRRLKKKEASNPLIEWLIGRRLELLLTQDQVSKLAGLATTHICSIEKGNIKPSLGSLKKIAKALGNCQIPKELMLPAYVKLYKESKTELGYFLTKRRLELGFDIKQVSRKAGLSCGVIARIENGSYQSTLKSLRKIACALKCEIPDKLISLPEKPKRHGNLGLKIERRTELGNLLTSQRLMRGLTQAEVAKNSGLSSGLISKVERGFKSKSKTIERITRALNFKIDL